MQRSELGWPEGSGRECAALRKGRSGGSEFVTNDFREGRDALLLTRSLKCCDS